MRRKDREITDIQKLESIINNCDVCRVAFANGDVPYIVTMNFGYPGGTEKRIYFHCANEGRKLDMIRNNDYVCFEFDTDHILHKGNMACDFGMSFSSVVGYGHITIVIEPEEMISGFHHIMSHYVGKGEFSYDQKVLERTLVLRLDITEMTGKIK
jgi:uncharacterized protein